MGGGGRGKGGGGVGSNSEPIPKPPHTNSSYIYNSRDDCCVTHNGRRETGPCKIPRYGFDSRHTLFRDRICFKICVLLQLLPRDGAVTKNSAPGIQKPQEPTKSGGRKHCIVNENRAKNVPWCPMFLSIAIFFLHCEKPGFFCVCVRMLMLRKD